MDKVMGNIFVNTIWWWQFGCSDGWTPDSLTKLGCVVKIRSMHKEEDSKIWVASLIIWLRTNWDVTFSIVIPSKLVLFWLHQCLDFALKSPMTTNKKRFLCTRVSRLIWRLSINAWKSSCFWLGGPVYSYKVTDFIFNHHFKIYTFS